jgi:hypothetical protein
MGRKKARGSVSNQTGRFERFQTVPLDDAVTLVPEVVPLPGEPVPAAAADIEVDGLVHGGGLLVSVGRHSPISGHSIRGRRVSGKTAGDETEGRATAVNQGNGR